MDEPPPTSSDTVQTDDELFAPGIVAIGASAGGLEALTSVLSTLPEDFPWPVLVAQHMDPTHVSQFSEILQRITKLTVQEAREGEAIRPGFVYACPPGSEISLAADRTIVFRNPVSGRPQRIDHLFGSVAGVALDKAIAVVLSGTGSDGSFGVLAIKRRGGVVIAESEATARQFGMPSSAIQTGAVDWTKPSDEIGPLLGRIIAGEVEAETPIEVDDIREILDVLKRRRGTTFDQYRMATLRRRIRRRMNIRGVGTLESYTGILQHDSEEADLLFDALLINVTEFFRDLEAWQALKTQVIPAIIERYQAGHEIRIWCPGCASGEEAYSIAMLIAEALDREVDLGRIKIFATDIDTKALAEARAGRYETSQMTNVSPERQARFFEHSGRGYEVSKLLRRMVIFGVHDLGRDPPIGRLDLLVCRNVLIYFDIPLQRRVFASFLYALSGSGALFLGASETVPRDFKGFVPLDRPSHLFRSVPTPGTSPSFSGTATTEQNVIDQAVREPRKKAGGIPNLVETVMESANLLVLVFDPEGAIQFSNRYASTALTGSSLSLEGQTFSDLVTGSPALVNALEEVTKGRRRSHARAAHLTAQGRPLVMDITFDPIKDSDGRPLILVVGMDMTQTEQARLEATDRSRDHQETIETLQQTNDELQSTNEELVTANEELQSANEELTTLNEEVQSTNEELETTNEELQSTNEELGAVNAELQRASAELVHLDALVLTALDATPNAIIVLDARDDIVRWGHSATEFFHLLPHQALGRNVHSLDLQVDSGIIREIIAQATRTSDLRTSEPVRMGRDGRRWAQVSARVVQPDAHRPREILLVFHDRTPEYEAQHAVAAASARYRALLRGTQEAVLIVGRDGRVQDATPTAQNILGIDLVKTGGRLWDLPQDPTSVLQVKGAVIDLMEHAADQVPPPTHSLTVKLRDGRTVTLAFVGVETQGEPPLIIVTEAKP